MKHHTAEASLLARLRKGEEAAYRELLGRHQRMLLAIAEAVLRNRATADEVVQDTWLAVVTHLPGFDGQARLSTWIVQILLNKARTRAKRDRRWTSFADAMAPEDLGHDERQDCFLANGHWTAPVTRWDVLDPERIVAGRELWSYVAKALDGLPAAQRAVVTLRDVEGLDTAEIERLLGLSSANVRVLLHRGRTRLRAVINALIGPSPHHALVKADDRNASLQRVSNPEQGPKPDVGEAGSLSV